MDGKDMAAMLEEAGVEPTAVRLAVTHVLADGERALPAGDILRKVRETMPVNKVTLYRILDLFVRQGLASRHSSGDRAFRYCLGPRFSGRAHGHAYCLRCGRMACLPATRDLVDVAALGRSLDMDVVGVEVRIDGVCAACRLAAEKGGTGGAVEDGAVVDDAPGKN
ncbi:Fur family transcriptional regulator [Solidesulfovibrio sp.]|jgi:Fur family ferric uptake transcriptional regulator|uniref:Fur family transcriptional regulator n=1 Tax=Solidesulfovibrio sp. TaxID=2910990 RepID=UPI002B1F9768|nr:Fur family transcriptional regulator [Solidesulfovibrio sp.]MEA5089133.1 Fur family transcriptional regulator [Solidesulfovibrio sp.]HML59936.1 Fur family transcriptional regulator [Solidesulfovibrio sp.]